MTDHAACLSLNTPSPSAKLPRWAMAIQEMDLELRHQSGRTYASADALSRHPTDDVSCSVASCLADPVTGSGEPVAPKSFALSDDTQSKLGELSQLQ